MIKKEGLVKLMESKNKIFRNKDSNTCKKSHKVSMLLGVEKYNFK